MQLPLQETSKDFEAQLKKAKKAAQDIFLHIPEYKDCPECEGEGLAEYEVGVPDFSAYFGGEIETRVGECENCLGSGRVEDDGMNDDNWRDSHGS